LIAYSSVDFWSSTAWYTSCFGTSGILSVAGLQR